jgi:rod shape-determining protein MreD
MKTVSNRHLCFVSVLVAVILQTASIGIGFSYLIVPWVLMTFIYWALESARPSLLFFAWFVGIIIDGFETSLLGEHSFALVFVLYGVMLFHFRLKNYSLFQQMIYVGLGAVCYQTIIFVVEWVSNGGGSYSRDYWLPSLVSLCLWPLVRLSLDFFNKNKEERFIL